MTSCGPLTGGIRQIRRCCMPITFSVVLSVLLSKLGWPVLIILAGLAVVGFYLCGSTVQIHKPKESNENQRTPF